MAWVGVGVGVVTAAKNAVNDSEKVDLLLVEKECGVAAAAEKKEKMYVGTTVTPPAAVPPTFTLIDSSNRCSSWRGRKG